MGVGEMGDNEYEGDVDSWAYWQQLKVQGYTSVKGNFYCAYEGLKRLTGAPVSVGGNFNCENNRLVSLAGSPVSIGGDFNCSLNSSLNDLQGAPKKIGGDFDCRQNGLRNLLGGPEVVNGDYCCASNPLTSVEGAPIYVGGRFDTYPTLCWSWLSSLMLSCVVVAIYFFSTTYEFNNFNEILVPLYIYAYFVISGFVHGSQRIGFLGVMFAGGKDFYSRPVWATWYICSGLCLTYSAIIVYREEVVFSMSYIYIFVVAFVVIYYYHKLRDQKYEKNLASLQRSWKLYKY